MRILENKVKPKLLDWPKEIICNHCKSKLLVDLSDLTLSNTHYSQREIVHNVKGFWCPCCREFNPIQ